MANNPLDIIIETAVDLAIKGQLTEGISQRLFHFCPVSSLYQILEFNAFKLTPATRPSDAKLTSLPINADERKQYPYYMCFSRTPSSLVGYVAMRRDSGSRENWKDAIVRIEVDGELISSQFKGMAVNYFNDKNLRKINHNFEYKTVKGPDGKPQQVKANYVTGRYGTEYSKRSVVNVLGPDGKIRKKDILRGTPHKDDSMSSRGKPRTNVSVDYGVIDRNQMSEYEDRLFSNKEYIKNATRYIKRIDIYVSENVLNYKNTSSQDIIFMLKELVNSEYSNLIHIYNNQGAFDTAANTYGGKVEKYKELDKSKIGGVNVAATKEDIALTLQELKTLIRYAVIVSFNGNGNNGWEEETIYRTKDLLINKCGINPEIVNDKMVDEEIMKHINSIKNYGKQFFYFQTKSLTKETDRFPSYKYKKYILPIDNEAENMRQNYSGKRKNISILSIQAKKCVN